MSYIVAVSFIAGGNRRTRRKPPTCRKSLTNLSHNIVHLALIEIRTHNNHFEIPCFQRLDEMFRVYLLKAYRIWYVLYYAPTVNKGNNNITELRTILQRESQNS